MPEVVSLEPTLPPQLGDSAAIKRELRERVRAAEDRLARERKAAGVSVMGVRAVLAQAFTDSPSTVEPRRTLGPRVAARNVWQRIEALRRNRDFLDAYRAARLLWRAGLDAVFPAGTYWLHRFAGVAVLPVPLSQP